MTETFTIAHFSDLHLGPLVGFERRYWNAKRAIGFYNWQRKRKRLHEPAIARRLIDDALGLGVDQIVITGDLINLGLPQEISEALDFLTSVSPPSKLTVIPGNHDIYSSLHGDSGIARWARYMGHEPETLAFPFVRQLGSVALIGLNSAIETKPFVAAGRLGRPQIEALGDVLDRLAEKNVIRVVLIHHPPLPGMASQRRALEDAHHLENVLTRHGAELVLYGHNHVSRVDWLRRPSGARVLISGVASGSATDWPGNPEAASYGLFTFYKTTAGLRIRRVVRGLSTGDGRTKVVADDVFGLSGEPDASAS